MAADFFYGTYAWRSQILDYQSAINLVTGSGNPSLRYAMYGNGTPAAWPNLSTAYKPDACAAVLMNGTVPDLQQGLGQAITDRIQGFWSSGDQLLVWSIRRRAGQSGAKTLALVMPSRSFLRVTGFQGVVQTNPAQIYGMTTWALLFTSIDDAVGPNYQGLRLDYLANNILGPTHGADPWV